MTFAHLDSARAEVAELGRRFAAAGHRLYLVGGIVRDQWLDHPLGDSADIDLTTDAPPAIVRDLVTDLADALWTQGERFGTIGLKYGAHDVEITTHRAETYSDDSRKPVVAFGTDIEVDLSRRDFTVNAMAVDVLTGELIDPWNGAQDLAAGLLRTPLAAEVSFGDDPVRMMRAARFAARFNLEPAAELVTAATEMSERLRIVAIERIGAEVRGLLGLDDPSQGLALLHDAGLLHELLAWNRPEVAYRDEVLVSARAAVARLSSIDWQMRLATMVAGLDPDPGAISDIVSRLRLSGHEQRRIVAAVTAATAVLELGEANPAALRRWRGSLGVGPGEAIAVAHALIDPADQSRFHAVKRFSENLAELMASEPDEPTVLSGDEVMGLLDVEAGPVVGEAITVLRQALFDKGPLPASAQAAIVRSWWSGRRTSI